jgi:hypothetical protein
MLLGQAHQLQNPRCILLHGFTGAGVQLIQDFQLQLLSCMAATANDIQHHHLPERCCHCPAPPPAAACRELQQAASRRHLLLQPLHSHFGKLLRLTVAGRQVAAACCSRVSSTLLQQPHCAAAVDFANLVQGRLQRLLVSPWLVHYQLGLLRDEGQQQFPVAGGARVYQLPPLNPAWY